MKKSIRKAIFPVGGLGTRFLPATKAMPKEMLTVVDKPIIQYAMEEAWAAGIEECILVTGRGKSAIEDHFDYSFELQQTLQRKGKTEALEKVESIIPPAGQVVYIRQQEPLGLGHAVWCARNLIGDEPFAVLLADDMVLSQRPCLQQMVDAYPNIGSGSLIATTEVSKEKTSLYGILNPESRNGNLIKATGMVEKPNPEDAPSNYAVIGRYILEPSIFDYLDKKVAGAGGEIQLTDAIVYASQSAPLHGFLYEGQRYDCGNRLGFIEANLAFALARPDMQEKVTKLIQSYLVRNAA